MSTRPLRRRRPADRPGPDPAAPPRLDPGRDGAVRRKFGGEPRAGRRVHPERPVRGRHPPARLLHLQAHLRGRRARRLVRQHRPPAPTSAARPRAATARDATEIFQEGLRIPPLKLYDGGRAGRGDLRADRAERARAATRCSATSRAQVAACLIGERGYLRAGRALRRRALRRLHRRRCSTTAERLARDAITRAGRTAATRSPTTSTTTASTRTRSRSRVAITVAGDRLVVDFDRLGAAGAGRDQLAAALHASRRSTPACGCLIGGDPAEQRGLLPPDRGDRAARHGRQPVLPARSRRAG